MSHDQDVPHNIHLKGHSLGLLQQTCTKVIQQIASNIQCIQVRKLKYTETKKSIAKQALKDAWIQVLPIPLKKESLKNFSKCSFSPSQYQSGT